jgi:hypothetical protein
VVGGYAYRDETRPRSHAEDYVASASGAHPTLIGGRDPALGSPEDGHSFVAGCRSPVLQAEHAGVEEREEEREEERR